MISEYRIANDVRRCWCVNLIETIHHLGEVDNRMYICDALKTSFSISLFFFLHQNSISLLFRSLFDRSREGTTEGEP